MEAGSTVLGALTFILMAAASAIVVVRKGFGSVAAITMISLAFVGGPIGLLVAALLPDRPRSPDDFKGRTPISAPALDLLVIAAAVAVALWGLAFGAILVRNAATEGVDPATAGLAALCALGIGTGVAVWRTKPR